VSCPLCSSEKSSLFFKDKIRDYYECEDCSLLFVRRDQLITEIEEKMRYELHENSESNESYRNYLTDIKQGVIDFLSPLQRGLDFGCGESLFMASLFEDDGIFVDSYDVFFHKNLNVFNHKYDFIILSEVIEHFRRPDHELSRLLKLLNPNGKIFIKTKLFDLDKDQFPSWYYKNDPTHIQFFTQKTLRFMKTYFDLEGPIRTKTKDMFYFSI
jgi:hypothetical protein